MQPCFFLAAPPFYWCTDSVVAEKRKRNKAPVQPPSMDSGADELQILDFVTPNRGWAAGLGGIMGGIVLERIDAPLWLWISTCLLSFGIAALWPLLVKTRRRQIWLACFAAAYVVLSVTIAALHEPKVAPTPAPTPAPEPSIAIFMKCDLTGMPLTIPAEGALRFVPVNEKYMKTNAAGSYEIRNDEAAPKKWPDKQRLEKAGKLHDFSRFLYKCEISNRGNVNVLDVTIPMRFWFGNKGGDENAVKFTPIVTPLDAGQISVLYFVNDCPTHATGILPEHVSLLVVGEKQRRNTPLHLPQRNIVDAIMMWHEAKTNWLGVTVCE